jgi:ribose transport system ATP-binding protein
VATLLSAEGITKAFGATVALLDVSLALTAGEIRGLVGGNGSGKSTLVKVLSGVHQAEPGGEIVANGARIATDAMSPEAAARAGLRFVHKISASSRR